MIRGLAFLLVAGATLLPAAPPAVTAFLKQIARPRVPLAAESKKIADFGDIEEHHFTYATENGQRVPGLLMKATGATRRLPAVVVLHGTGGSKNAQRNLLKRLATRGFVGIAIDGRYSGERRSRVEGNEYVEAILGAYRTGHQHPFLYDTVWDVLRLLDYLETRADVDARRIGMTGFSKGGMETYLAAAVDRRIRVAVPMIGVQSFRWALENNSWQSRASTFRAALNGAAQDEGVAPDAAMLKRFYDRVVPGIYSEFDGPAMLPLIAPRPLLVINGERDPRTPLPGLMECVEAAKKAYARAGAADRFEFLLQANTAHKVNPEALDTALEFLARHLRSNE